MTVIAAQPALFEVDEYTETDRVTDRQLCQRYFRCWLRAFGTGTTPVVEGITFTAFQAAADRLAQ